MELSQPIDQLHVRLGHRIELRDRDTVYWHRPYPRGTCDPSAEAAFDEREGRFLLEYWSRPADVDDCPGVERRYYVGRLPPASR